MDSLYLSVLSSSSSFSFFFYSILQDDQSRQLLGLMVAISCKRPAASQWDVMWSLIGLKFRKSVVMHTTVRFDVRQQTPKWCRRSNEPFDWTCYVSVVRYLLLFCSVLFCCYSTAFSPADVRTAHENMMKWMLFGNDVASNHKFHQTDSQIRG